MISLEPTGVDPRVTRRGVFFEISQVIAVAISLFFAPAAVAQESAPARSPLDALKAYTDELDARQGRVTTGQKFFGAAAYVGSQTCQSCHASQFQDWSKTWHAKMERWPAPDIVVGDFNNRTINYKDVRVRTKDGKEARVSFTVITSTKDGKYYFTVIDKDNEANNQTFQVAKVLGGKWDQNYEIKVGDNFLPALIRWSVAAQDWLISSYRPYDWIEWDGTADGRPRRLEELPKGRFAEAKCSGCHTTGFEFVKDTSGVWKAKGDGQLGIACERCHGPASRHVAEANSAAAKSQKLDPRKVSIVHPLKDLSPLQQTQVCAQCHGRNTHKKVSELSFQQGFKPGDVDMTDRVRFWSFSGTSNPDEYRYFWPNDWAMRNRQQWQDFTKSTHFNKAGMSCLTCHAFHGKTEGPQLRQAAQQLCVGCHTGDGYAKRPNAEMFAGSFMAKAGVQCVDCHMPKIGYRSDRTSKGPHPWDTSSHTFMVALPSLEKQQGIRSSCTGCHEGQDRQIVNGKQAPPMSVDDLDLIVRQRQTQTREAIDSVQRLIAGVNAKNPKARDLVTAAEAKLQFVLLDGSLGLHDSIKAAELIETARKLAEQARSME